MKTVIFFFSASSLIPTIVSPTPSGGPEGSKSLHQLARDGDIEGCRALKNYIDLNCIFDKWSTIFTQIHHKLSQYNFLMIFMYVLVFDRLHSVKF
jgi:hypothetical protein